MLSTMWGLLMAALMASSVLAAGVEGRADYNIGDNSIQNRVSYETEEDEDHTDEAHMISRTQLLHNVNLFLREG